MIWDLIPSPLSIVANGNPTTFPLIQWSGGDGVVQFNYPSGISGGNIYINITHNGYALPGFPVLMPLTNPATGAGTIGATIGFTAPRSPSADPLLQVSIISPLGSGGDCTFNNIFVWDMNS